MVGIEGVGKGKISGGVEGVGGEGEPVRLAEIRGGEDLVGSVGTAAGAGEDDGVGRGLNGLELRAGDDEIYLAGRGSINRVKISGWDGAEGETTESEGAP